MFFAHLLLMAHQLRHVRRRAMVPGIAQPLAGKSKAAPSLDGREHFKAYSAFLFDSGLLRTLWYKGFYLFLLQCLFPKLF